MSSLSTPFNSHEAQSRKLGMPSLQVGAFQSVRSELEATKAALRAEEAHHTQTRGKKDFIVQNLLEGEHASSMSERLVSRPSLGKPSLNNSRSGCKLMCARALARPSDGSAPI